MGIVNATPDSFSDAGELPDLEARVARGAALLGGGRRPARRRRRVGARRPAAGRRPRRRSSASCRVIERLAASSARLVSVDTYKPGVAAAAIAAGAAHRQRRLRAARPRRSPTLCARDRRGARGHAHARRAEGARCSIRDAYDDVVADVVGVPARADASSRAAHGVDEEQLLLDPGPGLRQDARADRRRAAAPRRAARAGAARCCWPSRARTSSARSPGARRASGWPARSRRVGEGVDAGAQLLRVHDVARGRATSSPCAPCCAASVSWGRSRASPRSAIRTACRPISR